MAEDTKVRTLGEAPRPYIYLLQGRLSMLEMQFVVKGAGTSDELVAVAGDVLDRVARRWSFSSPSRAWTSTLRSSSSRC